MLQINDIVTFTTRAGIQHTGVIVRTAERNGSTRYVVQVRRQWAWRPRHYELSADKLTKVLR